MTTSTSTLAIIAAILWAGQAASKQPEYLSIEEAVEKALEILAEASNHG